MAATYRIVARSCEVLVFELDDALGDVVFSALGARGGQKARTYIARNSSNATAMARLGHDLRWLLDGPGQARAHVGAGMALRVIPGLVPSDGFFASVRGRRGGMLWTATLDPSHVEALAVAAEAAGRHLLPEVRRGA